MTRSNLPVVIVGAGHAGGRCAERLRHFGWQGNIILVGDEPCLPYERPPLSKAVLVEEVEPSPSFVIDRDMLAALAIEHVAGQVVRSIDLRNGTVCLADERQIGYGKLVLATGLTPRRLPMLDVLGSRVCYLHKLEEARALRDAIKTGAKLLIVGAGFIGLEVAASARKLGAEVTVIEAAPQPLGRVLPARMANLITERHESAGIKILCNEAMDEIVQTPERISITLRSGETIHPDLVLVGIGGTPNDALARSAGLHVDNGIVVDDHCRTSDPDVYAIGDVASHRNPHYDRRWRLESWMNAEEMASNAARAICNQPPNEASVPYFWTDQFERRYQIAGLLEPKAEIYEQGVAGESGYLACFVVDGRMRGLFGINAGKAFRKAQNLFRGGAVAGRDELRGAGFLAACEPADA
ncbi:3-phenylpropionate/trans-cinnamate dioxygenase ferredoxin reductase subunit [Sinorhizobium terangae]|uniref:NAD(P)-binding protein n=1 Tax=Sinorhizobium terangae TaxID=110322 RepID=A0A6N7L9M2_SINTE|nr:FAD-dependent oxidoreductase [Sinorhizobium terangae]MBB4187784.1 3-phenylpropionate/trans-cinnamate dioxygenase ferredoxin reductase subunit [Sinorhizobium terangae]MQX13928.1 NAD(P)-binding protein [Sinorhizobium terangae]